MRTDAPPLPGPLLHAMEEREQAAQVPELVNLQDVRGQATRQSHIRFDN
jgi:hypothetical protein